jgi:type I restriction enzyme S subunit
MSVVLEAQEPQCLATLLPTFVRQFDVLSAAPGSVARLRELIVSLAIQGRLVSQDACDRPATELLATIRAEKEQLQSDGTLQRSRASEAIADAENPFEIPSSWAWARLPEISYDLGQGTPTSDFTYIDVGAIDNERATVTDSVEVFRASDAPSRARKRVASGTVLYSTVRPYLKNIAIVEKDYVPGAIASTAFAILHPHTGVHGKYLLCALRSSTFTEFVASRMAGIAYPAINDANFFQGVVPLPPSAEQVRIVARVEELMKLCDALEENGRLADEQHARLTSTLFDALAASGSAHELQENWRQVEEHFDLLLDRPEAIDVFEETILALAVRGHLVRQELPSGLQSKVSTAPLNALDHTDSEPKEELVAVGNDDPPFAVPLTWRWNRFGEILDFQGGSQPPKSRFSDSPRTDYVRLIQIRDLGDKPQPIFVSRDEVSKFCSSDDIMVGRYGASVGKVFWGIEGAYNVALVKMVDDLGRFDRRFLYVLLSSPVGQNWFKGISRSAQSGFNKSDIGPNWVPVPPLAEQRRIVARVEELRALCARLRDKLTMAQATQTALADALVATVAQ